MRSTLQAIWRGLATPILVYRDDVGPSNEDPMGALDYVQPWDDWAAEITTAATAHVGALAGIAYDAPSNRWALASAVPCTWSMDGAFAEFLGFVPALTWSTDFGAPAIADGPPPVIISSAITGLSAPIYFWGREMRGQDPVMWRQTMRAFRFVWRIPYMQTIGPFDPRRVPFILHQGNTDPWSLTARDGWLALRPEAAEYSRQMVGRQGRAMGDYHQECVDMRFGR